LVALVAKSVTVHGFKGFPLTAGFKGCILITVRYFVSALYGKTARFYFPTQQYQITAVLRIKAVSSKTFYESIKKRNASVELK